MKREVDDKRDAEDAARTDDVADALVASSLGGGGGDTTGGGGGEDNDEGSSDISVAVCDSKITGTVATDASRCKWALINCNPRKNCASISG